MMVFFAADDRAHGQQVGGVCRAPLPPSVEGRDPSAGGEAFQLVPSICVSERYDSNVFYRPPTPGLERADFVTNMTPMLRVNHNGEYVSGFLDMAGFAEIYVKNPDLNYLGTRDTLSVTLDNTIRRLLPNASLRIDDTFSYTPLPPGFVNPAAGTSPSAPGNIQNIYAIGFLGARTNNVINNGAVSMAYATTPSTSIYASYSSAILRWLSSSLPQGTANLFDTTAHTGSVGGNAQVSRVDTLNVKYAYGQIAFTPTSSSPSSPPASFVTNIATVGWQRVFTTYLKAEVGGGGIWIDPGPTTYAANAALIMNVENNQATISYVRSAYPSYAGVSTVLISDTVSLSAIQKIDQRWQVVERAYYSHSSGDAGANRITYDSYGGEVGVEYLVTRTWSAALGYGYVKFDQTLGTAGAQFDRHVAMISVRATWE